MFYGKVKMFLLLFISLVSMCDFHVLSKTHSTELYDDANDLSDRLTAFPPLSDEITELTPTIQNKQKANRKYAELVGRPSRNVLFDKEFGSLPDENKKKEASEFSGSFPFKLSLDLTAKKRQWPQIIFDKRLRKRDLSDKNDHARNGISRRNLTKAQVLGRLLLSNVSKKNEKDVQDDYIEDDDDDDYSKHKNIKKMNWEDYRNEDGASVMELVALNTRHKMYMQLGLDNDYLY
ncbi:uncharacterized protein LOC117228939 [Megalopta genalis]|uniref:uncharacterized protein LOC117228939 n=1 Tax=Megalopta genalis TaxID=115081 RepID=UPI003FD5EBCE